MIQQIMYGLSWTRNYMLILPQISFNIFHSWMKGYMLVKLMHFTKILTVSNRILIMIFHPMTAYGRIIA